MTTRTEPALMKQRPLLNPDALSNKLQALASQNELFVDDTLFIPYFLSISLIGAQVLSALAHCVARRRHDTGNTLINTSSFQLRSWAQIQVEYLGGKTITRFYVARLLGCLILLCLSLRSSLECHDEQGHLIHDFLATLRFSRCHEIYATLTFFYASVLALLSLTSKTWSKLATRFNIVLLLATFVVYFYRDIWPLAVVDGHPEDASQGISLWTRIGVLFVVAVIVPLFIPRRHIPIDPKDPMAVANDEQTCSIFSLLLYTFLDPIIMLGYRVPHLGFEQLPPLADSDHAQYLTAKAFMHLDPFRGAKERHLFFGLMHVLRKEYMILAFMLLLQGISQFLAPIGINRILSYLETNGQHATIRPWFWILGLFFGPAISAICLQWYIFLAMKTSARTEGLLTQLIFEHSMRIRLEVDDSLKGFSESESDTLARHDTPETISVTDSESRIVDGATTVTGSCSGEVHEPSNDSESTATLTTSNSKKGKSREETPPLQPLEKAHKKGIEDQRNFAGKINNLVTTDLTNVMDGRDFLVLFLLVPLQISVSLIFLHQVLGWSAFIGLVTMIALIPIPGLIAKRMQDLQKARMKKTDARVQQVTEAINVLRMVKLFGWERKMDEQIDKRREEELLILWKLKLLSAMSGLSNFLIPTLSMLMTYATFTIVMKEQLNASKIFSSMAVFTIVRVQMFRISSLIQKLVTAKVSLDRLDKFLKDTELLDEFAEAGPGEATVSQDSERHSTRRQVIGFNDATFSWSFDSQDASLTSRKQAFRLRVPGELLFREGVLNLIHGPTGSGKTSMLMALLGEMHFVPRTANSWFHLPREGGVAYAAQESWVLNATIRENILFGQPYEEDRYHKVINQCALRSDLKLFEAGDMTEVGERGLTLSGGQKARITLARAIYSPANILLLDDMLAPLDVHTSSWIVNHCLRGDLVKGRTVLLVTHNTALITPIAAYIISLHPDGSIEARENHGPVPTIEVHEAAENITVGRVGTVDQEGSQVRNRAHDKETTDNQLVVKEEILEGHINWESFKLFLSGLGGRHPGVFFSIWLSGFALALSGSTLQIWFLGYWGRQYESHPALEVNEVFYISIYALILVAMLATFNGAYLFYTLGSIRASRKINASLVKSILASTLRWLDETPTGRIISRCTQDIRTVDDVIPQGLSDLVEVGIAVITSLIVIVIFTPSFLFPAMGIAGLASLLGNVFLKARLSVKREMSNARSPLLAHFSAATAGIVSIRAYGAQDLFKAESLKRIDHYVRIARTSYNLNCWIAIRIDLLGGLFTASLATYLVYSRRIGSSNTGFALNMAVDFCTMILWWVRIFNEFEVQANSLERIQGFINIEHEPLSTDEGRPPASWPTSGELRVENLSARYSETGPRVLHDVSFKVSSGERIGIVGRTGSGKSSLILALLRCIRSEGTVYYDGIETTKVNLDALRSAITIIPQTPELLSGTLRHNLDPFGEHDDATLNSALRAAGLFSLQDTGEARIVLDSDIATGGNNLSVGQRQVLALARAMVRGSKLLILDEATSAIDYRTDSIIQKALRNQLPQDVTVITIAHRLQTVMDADKILVLENGRIVEFDEPGVLLQRSDGLLKAFVDGSGDKDTLFAMSERKA